MRSYWIRILLGAFVIFAIGMIGVTLTRKGVVRVNDFLHGSGPISLPLAFIPFEIGGNKLGTLEHVTLERTATKQISSVRVEVRLEDSLVAQGLSGCRLAANFDASHDGAKGVHVRTDPAVGGTFRCLQAGESDSTLAEFGQAVLQPGEVTLALLLPKHLVADLQTGAFFSDSTETSDSLTSAMTALGDSIEQAQARKTGSLEGRQLAESLRAVGRIRFDSLQRAALELADSAVAASLKKDASRPR